MIQLFGTERRINASVKLTIIVSDNGLSPDRHQAVLWTNAAILSIAHWEIYLSGFILKLHKFLLMEMHLIMSSVKWRPVCHRMKYCTSLRIWWFIRHIKTLKVVSHISCTFSQPTGNQLQWNDYSIKAQLGESRIFMSVANLPLLNSLQQISIQKLWIKWMLFYCAEIWIPSIRGTLMCWRYP